MSYLSSFFLSELEIISQTEQVKLSSLTINYLSELMEAGTQKNFLFQGGQKKYLVDLYKQAIESTGKIQRAQNFKHLGDYSLLVAGFFTESIDEFIGIEYYISMGQAAYLEAALTLGIQPFLELSTEYLTCMSMLHEIAINEKNIDPMQLYNFWTITKSSFTRKRLVKIGIVPEMVYE